MKLAIAKNSKNVQSKMLIEYIRLQVKFSIILWEHNLFNHSFTSKILNYTMGT